MEKKRVLLVDDHDELTTLCGLLLEGTGRFHVRSVHEGARALDVAREFRPDLIFLDWHLPDKDGLEIAAELREDRELGAVPVVFLTGAVTREEAMATARGGAETMAKPFASGQLIKRALELVDGLDRLVA